MGINDKMIKLIEKYQNNKLPNTPPRCVHIPTCSSYSKECYKKFNFFKATFLTIKRIIFCTPLNKKLYDPVPLTIKEKIKDKELKKIAAEIEPLILSYYQNYPNSYPINLCDFIYQITFNTSIESNIDISNLSTINNNDLIIVFYKRIDILINLIKKKKLPFNKKKGLEDIKSFLSSITF